MWRNLTAYSIRALGSACQRKPVALDGSVEAAYLIGMSLYNLLAERYGEIFPLEAEKVEFVRALCPAPPARVVDVGCATGDLALALRGLGFSAVGIDLNARMIDLAADRGARYSDGLEFRVLNMLDVAEIGSCDCAFCFGNTLPHLASLAEVLAFFRAVYSILPTRGVFAFQLLNYDRILAERHADFPAIETAHIAFRRRYEFLPDGRVDFRVELRDKATDQAYADSTALMPLRRADLLDGLTQSGFGAPLVFSDYGHTKSDGREFSSVYVCRKP